MGNTAQAWLGTEHVGVSFEYDLYMSFLNIAYTQREDRKLEKVVPTNLLCHIFSHFPLRVYIPAQCWAGYSEMLISYLILIGS